MGTLLAFSWQQPKMFHLQGCENKQPRDMSRTRTKERRNSFSLYQRAETLTESTEVMLKPWHHISNTFTCCTKVFIVVSAALQPWVQSVLSTYIYIRKRPRLSAILLTVNKSMVTKVTQVLLLSFLFPEKAMFSLLHLVVHWQQPSHGGWVQAPFGGAQLQDKEQWAPTGTQEVPSELHPRLQ